MTDIEQPPQNGIDPTAVAEDENNKARPADIEQDMREMERRKRVEAIMGSKLFREELERIVDSAREGSAGASGILQQLSDIVGVPVTRVGSVFKSSNCMVPINDIRGVESMGYAKGEKILRCKLAATFRLLDLYGWTQGLGAQITARLKVDQEYFLVNPYGLLYHEITASALNKVDMQGQIVEQGTTNFGVNKSHFGLHSVVHAARPDIRCAIYIGCSPVVAISSLKSGLLPLTKDACVLGEITTHAYTGLLDEDERDRLVRSLGPNSKVILLANHGALCCGETIEEAFHAACHIVQACETQLKLLPVGLDNLVLIPEESRKAIYDQSRRPPEDLEKKFAAVATTAETGGAVAPADPAESTPRLGSPPKWRVGGAEFEALMRMLDNAGYRTGYIYRHPLIKSDPPKPKNDVELPPAVSSLGYLLEEEELFRQGIWKKGDIRKGGDRSRWLNSPNVYQKVEVLETGTPDPKKITKWVAEGSPTHSTPVRIEDPLQFVPAGTTTKEFKRVQQQIKDNRRADKISAGPQSHILEGVTWDEANRIKDATVSQAGDHVVLMGAASKGIIQRGFQHNATVYKAPYAKNPFDNVTDDELNEYKRTVERKKKSIHGEYTDTDFSESEALNSMQVAAAQHAKHAQSEPETDHQVIQIQTQQAPIRSQVEVVQSDATLSFLNGERSHTATNRKPPTGRAKKNSLKKTVKKPIEDVSAIDSKNNNDYELEKESEQGCLESSVVSTASTSKCRRDLFSNFCTKNLHSPKPATNSLVDAVDLVAKSNTDHLTPTPPLVSPRLVQAEMYAYAYGNPVARCCHPQKCGELLRVLLQPNMNCVSLANYHNSTPSSVGTGTGTSTTTTTDSTNVILRKRQRQPNTNPPYRTVSHFGFNSPRPRYRIDHKHLPKLLYDGDHRSKFRPMCRAISYEEIFATPRYDQLCQFCFEFMLRHKPELLQLHHCLAHNSSVNSYADDECDDLNSNNSSTPVRAAALPTLPELDDEYDELIVQSQIRRRQALPVPLPNNVGTQTSLSFLAKIHQSNFSAESETYSHAQRKHILHQLDKEYKTLNQRQVLALVESNSKDVGGTQTSLSFSEKIDKFNFSDESDVRENEAIGYEKRAQDALTGSDTNAADGANSASSLLKFTADDAVQLPPTNIVTGISEMWNFGNWQECDDKIHNEEHAKQQPQQPLTERHITLKITQRFSPEAEKHNTELCTKEEEEEKEKKEEEEEKKKEEKVEVSMRQLMSRDERQRRKSEFHELWQEHVDYHVAKEVHEQEEQQEQESQPMAEQMLQMPLDAQEVKSLLTHRWLKTNEVEEHRVCAEETVEQQPQDDKTITNTINIESATTDETQTNEEQLGDDTNHLDQEVELKQNEEMLSDVHDDAHETGYLAINLYRSISLENINEADDAVHLSVANYYMDSDTELDNLHSDHEEKRDEEKPVVSSPDKEIDDEYFAYLPANEKDVDEQEYLSTDIMSQETNDLGIFDAGALLTSIEKEAEDLQEEQQMLLLAGEDDQLVKSAEEQEPKQQKNIAIFVAEEPLEAEQQQMIVFEEQKSEKIIEEPEQPVVISEEKAEQQKNMAIQPVEDKKLKVEQLLEKQEQPMLVPEEEAELQQNMAILPADDELLEGEQLQIIVSEGEKEAEMMLEAQEQPIFISEEAHQAEQQHSGAITLDGKMLEEEQLQIMVSEEEQETQKEVEEQEQPILMSEEEQEAEKQEVIAMPTEEERTVEEPEAKEEEQPILMAGGEEETEQQQSLAMVVDDKLLEEQKAEKVLDHQEQPMLTTEEEQEVEQQEIIVVPKEEQEETMLEEQEKPMLISVEAQEAEQQESVAMPVEDKMLEEHLQIKVSEGEQEAKNVLEEQEQPIFISKEEQQAELKQIMAMHAEEQLQIMVSREEEAVMMLEEQEQPMLISEEEQEAKHQQSVGMPVENKKLEGKQLHMMVSKGKQEAKKVLEQKQSVLISEEESDQQQDMAMLPADDELLEVEQLQIIISEEEQEKEKEVEEQEQPILISEEEQKAEQQESIAMPTKEEELIVEEQEAKEEEQLILMPEGEEETEQQQNFEICADEEQLQEMVMPEIEIGISEDDIQEEALAINAEVLLPEGQSSFKEEILKDREIVPFTEEMIAPDEMPTTSAAAYKAQINHTGMQELTTPSRCTGNESSNIFSPLEREILKNIEEDRLKEKEEIFGKIDYSIRNKLTPSKMKRIASTGTEEIFNSLTYVYQSPSPTTTSTPNRCINDLNRSSNENENAIDSQASTSSSSLHNVSAPCCSSMHEHANQLVSDVSRLSRSISSEEFSDTTVPTLERTISSTTFVCRSTNPKCKQRNFILENIRNVSRTRKPQARNNISTPHRNDIETKSAVCTFQTKQRSNSARFWVKLPGSPSIDGKQTTHNSPHLMLPHIKRLNGPTTTTLHKTVKRRSGSFLPDTASSSSGSSASLNYTVPKTVSSSTFYVSHRASKRKASESFSTTTFEMQSTSDQNEMQHSGSSQTDSTLALDQNNATSSSYYSATDNTWEMDSTNQLDHQELEDNECIASTSSTNTSSLKSEQVSTATNDTKQIVDFVQTMFDLVDKDINTARQIVAQLECKAGIDDNEESFISVSRITTGIDDSNEIQEDENAEETGNIGEDDKVYNTTDCFEIPNDNVAEALKVNCEQNTEILDAELSLQLCATKEIETYPATKTTIDLAAETIIDRLVNELHTANAAVLAREQSEYAQDIDTIDKSDNEILAKDKTSDSSVPERVKASSTSTASMLIPEADSKVDEAAAAECSSGKDDDGQANGSSANKDGTAKPQTDDMEISDTETFVESTTTSATSTVPKLVSEIECERINLNNDKFKAMQFENERATSDSNCLERAGAISPIDFAKQAQPKIGTSDDENSDKYVVLQMQCSVRNQILLVCDHINTRATDTQTNSEHVESADVQQIEQAPDVHSEQSFTFMASHLEEHHNSTDNTSMSAYEHTDANSAGSSVEKD